jgi:hypothetical protein
MPFRFERLELLEVVLIEGTLTTIAAVHGNAKNS